MFSPVLVESAIQLVERFRITDDPSYVTYVFLESVKPRILSPAHAVRILRVVSENCKVVIDI